MFQGPASAVHMYFISDPSPAATQTGLELSENQDNNFKQFGQV